MTKHKHLGFTVVELVIVLVVIAMLVTITTVAYRTTQADSRDKKRQADALMLKAAVEEYYADNGSYPRTGACTTGDGGNDECWSGEIWTFLKTAGYLDRVPMPEARTKATTSAGKNLAPNNQAYYGYITGTTGAFYGMYIPRESSNDCKIAKGSGTVWSYTDLDTCSF